jgi:TPR repeat protein
MFRLAADAGNPDAQYALATLYKEGRGVPKDLQETARLLAAAARADNTDAQVEYAIALFNGTGVAKDETEAAEILQKAAEKGSPIAQNRLARILSVGRGLPADPVAAVKWHLVSKAGGATDLNLDDFVRRQPPQVRAAGQKAAEPLIAALKAAREPRS